VTGRHGGRVTGGAGGIGRAYVRRLASEGAAVAVLDRADAADASDDAAFITAQTFWVDGEPVRS
jgi:NAD(P)-dependent dehydrogenase (short-subunit alcohol dehydrogenase family)